MHCEDPPHIPKWRHRPLAKVPILGVVRYGEMTGYVSMQGHNYTTIRKWDNGRWTWQTEEEPDRQRPCYVLRFGEEMAEEHVLALLREEGVPWPGDDARPHEEACNGVAG